MYIHAHVRFVKNSVRNKNPKSLQVVQAQSVCMYVCVHVCVCTGVYVHAHVRFVQTVWRNMNLKSLQMVQARSVCMYVCVHVCAQVCTFMHMYTLCTNSVEKYEPKVTASGTSPVSVSLCDNHQALADNHSLGFVNSVQSSYEVITHLL